VGKRRDTFSKRAALDVRLRPDDRTAAPDDDRHRGSAKAHEGARAERRTRRPARGTRAGTKSREPEVDDTDRSETPRRAFRLAGLLYWGVVLAIWSVIGFAGLFAWVAFHLPPIQSLAIPKRPPTIQINTTDGRIFATRGEMGGAAIPINEMPTHLPNAFLAIEDRRFYRHHGIDPIGLTRAMLANLFHRGISQGGSTITQQLAKNLFLSRNRKMMRKLQEIVLALWLEHKFTKAEILELYLNRVYFGAGAYGVEAAAQRYFGKSARHVTLSEAALLAGLIKSPSRLAPTKNYDGAERRGQRVLAAMSEAGFINEDAAQAAMALGPTIVKASGGGSSNYVADWVMDVLNDLVGLVEEDVVVDTTIDVGLQAAAEKALLDQLAQKGQKFGVEQGAVVAMAPDGAVRALVGGRNYAENQFNRAIAAKRQPGSTFKPFVYLTALERGLTPDSVRDDRPIELKGWRPENFNREYFGPVTLTQALANSLNSVSVRLTLELGPTAVVRTAHRLGIASKLEANPSIALGTSEVSVLELVSAYAPFANGGLAVIPHVVERVRTAQGGKTLYTRSPNTLGRVVDVRYVAMMNAMMHETVANGTARRADLPGWAVAGKTGTSQDFRDAWFVGYTSQLVTGVWLGNDDNTPTKKITGGGFPVEVWSQFMRAAHRGKSPSDLPGGAIVAAIPPPNAGIPGVPIPPAGIPGGRGREAVRPPEGTMDGWFLERLFSRR
jgi:penicillin-binding protein 1A